MWGGFLVVCCLGRLLGLGRLGGLPLREAGRPTVSRGFVLAGGVGLSGAGMRDTPAAACWVVVGASACVGVACCRGSGAVRPGCLTCLGLLVVGGCGWVWVGWL